jgi:hypothetical protein
LGPKPNFLDSKLILSQEKSHVQSTLIHITDHNFRKKNRLNISNKVCKGPSIKYVLQLGEEVTDLWRSLRIILHQTLEFCDEGEEGVKNWPKLRYILYGRPLIHFRFFESFSLDRGSIIYPILIAKVLNTIILRKKKHNVMSVVNICYN